MFWNRKASRQKAGEAAVLWVKRGDVEAMQKMMEEPVISWNMRRSSMTVLGNVIMVAVVGQGVYWMAGEPGKTASGAWAYVT